MELTRKEQFALGVLQSLLKPFKDQDPDHNINMAVAYANDLEDALDKKGYWEEVEPDNDEPEPFIIDSNKIYDINRYLSDNPYALMFSGALGGCNAKFRIVSLRVHEGLHDENKNIYLMEQIDKPDKRFEITDVLLDKYFK